MADQQTGNKFVLVVEDDQFYGNIFKIKLSKEGYDVIVATDGEQGLKVARERKPDLILLDMIMPVKDGIETLKELRSDENLKNVKVIVLSNLGQENESKITKDMAVSDSIVKANMSIQEMVAKVKKYVL